MHRHRLSKKSTALQEMLAFLAVGVLTYPPMKVVSRASRG